MRRDYFPDRTDGGQREPLSPPALDDVSTPRRLARVRFSNDPAAQEGESVLAVDP